MRWETYDGTPQIHAEFKRKVVIQAMRGDETVRAIAARHGINANQLSKWKTQAHGRPVGGVRQCRRQPGVAGDGQADRAALCAGSVNWWWNGIFFRGVPRSGKRPEGNVHSGRRDPAADPQVRTGGRQPRLAVLPAKAGGRADAGATACRG